MYGYGEDRPAFDTLFGYELTRTEWKEQQRDRKKRGMFIQDAYGRPWHCLWTVRRNGGHDQNGEWEPSDSWTCTKIIKPSYSQHMAVKLVVNVYGVRFFRPGWRTCQPRRWSAHLTIGWRNRHFSDHKYAQSCKSIADAYRKAEKLPFLAAEVAALLKEAYGPAGAEAVFREMEDGRFEPFVTRLGVGGEGSRDMVLGKYLVTRWERPWQGPDKDKWVVRGSQYDRFVGGWSSGPYRKKDEYGPSDMERHNELVQRVGCWLPRPEE